MPVAVSVCKGASISALAERPVKEVIFHSAEALSGSTGTSSDIDVADRRGLKLEVSPAQ